MLLTWCAQHLLLRPRPLASLASLSSSSRSSNWRSGSREAWPRLSFRRPAGPAPAPPWDLEAMAQPWSSPYPPARPELPAKPQHDFNRDLSLLRGADPLLSFYASHRARFDAVSWGTLLHNLSLLPGPAAREARRDPRYLSAAESLPALAPFLPPRDLASLSFSLAKLRERELSRPFLEAADARSRALARRPPEEAANFLWACALLDFVPGGVLRELNVPTRAQLVRSRARSGEALARVAWACGELRVRPGRLLEQVDAAASRVVAEARPKHVANAAWALAGLAHRGRREGAGKRGGRGGRPDQFWSVFEVHRHDFVRRAGRRDCAKLLHSLCVSGMLSKRTSTAQVLWARAVEENPGTGIEWGGAHNGESLRQLSEAEAFAGAWKVVLGGRKIGKKWENRGVVGEGLRKKLQEVAARDRDKPYTGGGGYRPMRPSVELALSSLGVSPARNVPVDFQNTEAGRPGREANGAFVADLAWGEADKEGGFTRWYAVELNGPTCYLRDEDSEKGYGRGEEDGFLIAKRTALMKMGWRVVNVPWHVWADGDEASLAEFLRGELEKARDKTLSNNNKLRKKIRWTNAMRRERDAKKEKYLEDKWDRILEKAEKNKARKRREWAELTEQEKEEYFAKKGPRPWGAPHHPPGMDGSGTFENLPMEEREDIFSDLVSGLPGEDNLDMEDEVRGEDAGKGDAW